MAREKSFSSFGLACRRTAGSHLLCRQPLRHRRQAPLRCTLAATPLCPRPPPPPLSRHQRCNSKLWRRNDHTHLQIVHVRMATLCNHIGDLRVCFDLSNCQPADYAVDGKLMMWQHDKFASSNVIAPLRNPRSPPAHRGAPPPMAPAPTAMLAPGLPTPAWPPAPGTAQGPCDRSVPRHYGCKEIGHFVTR